VSFDSLGLHPDVVHGVAARGFKLTTPIQTQVIPVAREGRDIIACAETGTGKTAAFVLPILDRLIRQREAGTSAAGKTRVLVLAPTRELAAQVDDDITGFAYHSGISSAVVCGGLPSDPQERGLRAGVDIVVATPGRLMDHMRCGVTDFSGLEVLVLDEADRMLDMGFWPDIQKIVESLPTERQTLLLSATIAGEVVELANAVVKNPEIIGQPRTNQLAPTISHAIEEMPAGSKTDWLARFLHHEQGPILVFVRTKRGADRLADRLKSAGVRCAALHADLSQPQRTSAMEGFRAGRFKALVATDLAARGLDIRGITHVVNFEVPSTKEAYVHRVGRTGRADALGTAITLVSPEERRALAALRREVGTALSVGN
jgi:ATP-dependent RNA helicase RhlE